MAADQLNPAPQVELWRCPVRRRYLWQLVRYGLPNRHWRRRLQDAASGGWTEAQRAERLRELLRSAEEDTTYYPRAFASAGVHWRDFRVRTDLRYFPVLSRAALQDAFYDVFSRSVTADDVAEGWLGRTSGSTGEPVRFFMDGQSIHFFTAFIHFLWEHHSLGPLPAPGGTGIVLLCTLPRSSIYETWLPLFRGTRFRKLHWDEVGAEDCLVRLAPSVITGDPDSLQRLAEAVETKPLARPPRLILSSAFALPPELSARLAGGTGATVVDYYSMAETGPLARRCPAGEMHVLGGAVELESVDGELVVTNLRNSAFPLIRYRTGDEGEVVEPSGPCACGTPGARLVGFGGRRSARFVSPTGRLVDPSQLQPLLSALPVRQFQLLQHAPEHLTLRFQGEGPLPPEALGRLTRGLGQLLGADALRLELAPQPQPLFSPGKKRIIYRSAVATPAGGAVPPVGHTASASQGSASSG